MGRNSAKLLYWMLLMCLRFAMPSNTTQGTFTVRGHYQISGSTWEPLQLSTVGVTQCIIDCTRLDQCISINYEGDTNSCRLLPLIASISHEAQLHGSNSWKHYVLQQRFPNTFKLGDSICMKYEKSNIDTSLGDQYICIKHPHTVDWYNSGHKDCVIKMMENIDVPGNDILSLVVSTWNITEQLTACAHDNCNAMICRKSSSMCWYKTKSHHNGATMVDYPGLHYWYPECT